MKNLPCKLNLGLLPFIAGCSIQDLRLFRGDSLAAERNIDQGTNGALGKPCLCPRDTRHFCQFRRLTGFEQQRACFTTVRMTIRHCRCFRQKPPLLAGQRHGLPNAPLLGRRIEAPDAKPPFARVSGPSTPETPKGLKKVESPRKPSSDCPKSLDHGRKSL